MSLQVMALCAGIGCLELGLSVVLDCHPVVFVEKDPYCQAVLTKRWPDSAILSDIFDPLCDYMPADVLTAGFPCQPFSLSGKQKGKSDERWIWPRIAEIICSVRPRFVFLENVPAIASGGGLEAVVGSLAEMGFSAEWGCFSCASLGAAHKRERWFLVAYSYQQQQDETREREGAQPYGSMPQLANNHDGQSCHLRCGEYLGKGVSLADSDSIGLRIESIAQPWSDGRTVAPGLGEDVANPEGGRRGQGGAEGAEIAERFGDFRPLWAPGRNPSDWESVPRRLHPPERSLRRVANGDAGKSQQPVYSHRIRSLGNAVSPPVAAVAWSVLLGRLMA